MLFSMGNVLVKSVAYSFGINWSAFFVANALKTEKFYDLTGSATFIFLTLKSLQWTQKYFLRQNVQSGMALLWAVRLGTYLFTRVMRDGFDRRFNNVKKSPKLFFMYWTIQAMWVFVTLLPTLIVNSKNSDQALTRQDYIGWAMWLVGFLIEVTADRQKSTFRANPDNAGKFINTGLWSLSRHPNYLGEILLWSGLFVSASSVFQGLDWISLLSPMFVAFLITNVSGIPILEKSGLKRWGADPAYQKYVKETAVLVPWLW